jgi:TP901 family phage tail tape measure protein
MGLMESAESLIVNFLADTTGFTAGVSEVKKGLTETDDAAAKSDSTFKGFTQTIKDNKTEITALGAGMTTAGVAVLALTDNAREINSQLAGTAITLGSTTEELRDLALASSDAGFPLDDVVATFDLLARSGLTEDQLAATAAAFDDLGDATGTSAATVTESLIPAFNAFDIPLTEVGDHVDGITYLTKNSTISFEDFAGTVGVLAPKLDAMGLSMEDTEALLLAMSDAGLQGTAATKALRLAVGEMDTQFGDYQTALSDAITQSKDLEQTSKDLDRAEKDLAQTQKDLSTATRDTTLGLKENSLAMQSAQIDLQKMQTEGKGENETAQEFNIRLEEQKLRIESLTYSHDDLIARQTDLKTKTTDNTQAQKDNTKAQTDNEAAIVLNGLSQKELVFLMGDSTNKTEAFYDALGLTKDQVDAYKVKIEGAGGSTKAYADAAETSIGSTDKMKSAFDEFALSAGTTLEPLDGLAAAMSISGPLIIGITGLPALIGLVNTSLLFLAANPIVLVVAAIVGLVAVIILLETEFGVVSACADALGVAWQWLSDSVIAPFIGWLTEATAGIDVIGVAFTVLLGPIGLVSMTLQALGYDWEDVWNAITWVAQESADLITGLIDALMEGIEWAFDWTIGAISDQWESFWDDVSWVTESASNIITGIVEGLTDAIEWAFDALIYPLQDAWDNLWGGMEDTISATSDFIMGIVDGITGSITGMINIAIDSINSMIEGVNALSFDIPDLFGGPPTHIGFDIAPIPRLASGGIVTSPTLAMIGEAGPEAVIPLSGGSAGAMGGVTITGNTFNVRNDGDIKAIAIELQTLITRTNRGRGIS